MPPAKEKILVVDDDLDALDLVAKQALAPQGFQVATATDGSAAIQKAVQLRPDLIIASLQLPGLSGKDLMVALRSQGFESPVLVTATHGMEQQAIAALRLGASDYLTKPLREAEVVSAVDRALKEVRLRRERTQLAESLAQANKQMERRVKELTTLYGIGKAVTSSTDLQGLLNRVLEAALFVAEAEVGYLLLVDDETGKLLLRAGKNLPAAAARLMNAPFDDGISSLVVLSGEPLSIHGEALSKFKIASLVRAALVAPMKVKEKVVGLLVVGHKTDKPFSDRDEAMLSAVADYASVALVNTRLFEALEARAASLQKAYDEATAAEKLRTDVVRNVSHELRTPLIHARSYAEMLVRGDLGKLTPDQLGAAKTISEKIDVVTRIVDNMAALSQAQPGAEQGETTSLVALARQAVARYQLAAQGAGVALNPELPIQELKVVVVAQHIARVFDEYLSNAIKFSPPGGTVTLRLRDMDDGTLEVMVADTGIGIPPDKLNKIFDRFYQVDSSTTRRYGGVGLGLSLVKQTVEAHGGQAWAESEGVAGKGSKFYFTLPKAE